jgi:hypothetical protein
MVSSSHQRDCKLASDSADHQNGNRHWLTPIAQDMEGHCHPVISLAGCCGALRDGQVKWPWPLKHNLTRIVHGAYPLLRQCRKAFAFCLLVRGLVRLSIHQTLSDRAF